ncbi:MAG TPA: GYF domain-containing protein [Chthoniobacteraceae bacterium]|nr:GYF domain-containing protein [Chthoniobacteraceae bacterium]
MKWYYANDSERIGPLEQADWDQLVQTDEITPETLVWNPTLPAWTPYRDLCGNGETAPPPPPGELSPQVEADHDDPRPIAAALQAAAAKVEEEHPELPAEMAREEEPLEVRLEQIAARDYEVATGSLLARSFSLMRRRFLRLVGLTVPPLILMALISELLASPLMKVIFSLIYEPAMLAGIYALYLQTIRGGGKASDLVRGFSRGVFGSVVATKFILQGILYLCLFVGLALVQISGLIDAGNAAQEWQEWPPMVWLVLLLVGSVALLPALYFGFCWMFAVPLILDHAGIGYQRALRLSRHKVLQHPWRLSIFLTLLSLILMIPFLLLFAGSFWYAGSLEAWQGMTTEVAQIGVLLLLGCGVFFLVALLYLYEAIFSQPVAYPAPDRNADPAP